MESHGKTSVPRTEQDVELQVAFLRAAPYGLPREAKQAAIDSDPKQLRALLGQALQPQVVTPIQSIITVVNYDLTVEQLVEAGHYDSYSRDITSTNFPIGRSGQDEVEFFLYHHSQLAYTEEIKAGMDEVGLRPAGPPITGILTVGIEYAGFQRRFPIVDLDSVFQRPRGDLGCAYLDGDASGRLLGLRLLEARWSPRCRFLALRKPQPLES